VKYAATDEMIALRLSEGDDLGDSIAHVCRTCDVDSAVIVSAEIGRASCRERV
jgi:predicted DNA-binding protein with PD1-like motif